MPRLTPDKSFDEDIKRLHAAGKGRNEVCRELELSAGFVSRAAERLGLKFDGSQVLMATEVRRREAAERRAVLTISLLDDAEKLRDRLFKPMVYIQYGGKDFDRKEDKMDQPTPQDQAHLVRAIGTLIDKARGLDEYDRIGSTLADAFAWIDSAGVTIIQSVGQVVPELPAGADDARTLPETS